MSKKLSPLEQANDELDLNEYELGQLLHDKEALAAIRLLIERGYSVDNIKAAWEDSRPLSFAVDGAQA